MDAKRLLDDSIPNAGEMSTFLLLRDQFREDKWCLIAWKYAFYAHFFIGIISIKLQSDCVKYCKCLLIDLIPDCSSIFLLGCVFSSIYTIFCYVLGIESWEITYEIPRNGYLIYSQQINRIMFCLYTIWRKHLFVCYPN